MKVLYVEDDPRDIELTLHELKRSAPDIEMNVVSTIGEALNLLKPGCPFDLLLTDYMLPDGEGIELLTYVRSQALPIPVVVMTGLGDEEVAISVIKTGADDYVVKQRNYLKTLPNILERAYKNFQQNALAQIQPIRVLYAEHNPLDVDLTLRYFNEHAFYIHFEVVNTADEVLKRLADTQKPAVDVLLLDYRLPGMDGIELLRELRLEFLVETPIVMVTGQGDEEVALNAFRLGAADYVLKNTGYLIGLPGILENAYHRAQIAKDHAVLAASEVKYRTLAESAHEFIIIIDFERKILYANEFTAQFFACKTEDLVGTRWDVLFPFEYSSVPSEEVVHDVRSGKTVYLEIFWHYQQKKVWLGGWVSPLPNEKNVITSIMVIARDISSQKSGEEELIRTDNRLKEAQKMARLGSWEYDIPNDLFHLSDEVLQLFQITEDMIEPTARGFVGLIHPEDRGRAQQLMQAATSENHITEAEFRVVFPNSKMYICDLKAETTYGSTGKPLKVFGTIQDITEIRVAEKALMESEVRFKTLVEGSPLGIAMARKGQLILSNPTYAKMFGFAHADEVAGTLLIDNIAHSARKMIAERNRKREQGLAVPSRYETTGLRKDGSEFPMEAEITTLQLAEGITTLGFFTDITARKEAENSVHESEIRFRTLFEEAAIPLMEEDFSEVKKCIDQLHKRKIKDIEAYYKAHPDEFKKCISYIQVLDVNRSAIEMYEAENKETLLGSIVPMVVYDEKSILLDEIVAFDKGQLTFEGECVNRTLKGNLRNVLLRLSLAPAAIGTWERVLVSTVDMTERVQSRELLQHQLDELKALHAVAIACSESQQLDDLLTSSIKIINSVLDAKITGIMLIDPSEKILNIKSVSRGGRAILTSEIPVGDGIVHEVIKTGKLIRVDDVRTYDKYVSILPDILSEICVPMRIGNRVTGVLNCESDQLQAFSESEERLLTTIAGQLATAIEQLRLYEETRQRVAELEAINRISIALRKTQNSQDLYKILLNEAIKSLDGEAGMIVRYNEIAGVFETVAVEGWFNRFENLQLLPTEGIVGKVYSSGEAYISSELRSDPNVSKRTISITPAGKHEIVVPLRSEQETIGVLYVAADLSRNFSPKDIHLLTTIAEIGGNSIRRATLYEKTELQLKRLAALRSIDLAISSIFDLRIIMDILLEQVIKQLSVDAANILLYDSNSKLITRGAGTGFRSDLQAKPRFHLGESLAGKAALERRTIVIPDLRTTSEKLESSDLLEGEDFRAYFAVPLVTKGQLMGVLELFNRKPLYIDNDWTNFLETMGVQMAIAIDNFSMYDGLQRSNMNLALAYDATIEGWSKALDLRDRETEGHTQRVTDMTMKLAVRMGSGGMEMIHIRRGALLHDIGKMGIPDEILHKPAGLTEEEWVVMRRHPQYAYDLINPISYLRPAVDIPYCHHERWDGTGYPRGLKGDKIPLAARIFSVVDVYDALTSDRPYRKAWDKTKTLAYIQEQSGTQFDPMVVNVFLDLVG